MTTVLIIIGLLILYFVVSAVVMKRKLKNYDPSKSSKNIIHLTDADFQKKLREGVALVDFWAEWCMPCKMQAPVIDELADEFADKAKICKMDVEQYRAVPTSLQIRNIPTLIIFKNGKEVERVVGLKPKTYLRKLLLKYLENK